MLNKRPRLLPFALEAPDVGSPRLSPFLPHDRTSKSGEKPCITLEKAQHRLETRKGKRKMTTATEIFSRQGKTLETVRAYVQQYINAHGQKIWQQHLKELEQASQQAINAAYRLYSRTLFQPLEDELRQAGLICDPRLPGTFPLSREQ
jgi:hypothetical protein